MLQRKIPAWCWRRRWCFFDERITKEQRLKCIAWPVHTIICVKSERETNSCRLTWALFNFLKLVVVGVVYSIRQPSWYSIHTSSECISCYLKFPWMRFLMHPTREGSQRPWILLIFASLQSPVLTRLVFQKPLSVDMSEAYCEDSSSVYSSRCKYLWLNVHRRNVNSLYSIFDVVFGWRLYFSYLSLIFFLLLFLYLAIYHAI